MVSAAAVTPGAGQLTNGVRYTLLEGSYLLDECLICERPTIQEPLRGTFDLVLLQNTAPYTKYAMRNIAWLASPGPAGDTRITGEGTYTRFEEFAVLQDMTLAVQLKDAYTNRPAFFTNVSRAVEQPFPLIQTTVRQTNGTLLQTFTVELFAAPVRELWFSTVRSFASTNRLAPTNQISAGDLLSNRGRWLNGTWTWWAGSASCPARRTWAWMRSMSRSAVKSFSRSRSMCSAKRWGRSSTAICCPTEARS
jgi:hypothetical protein